MVQFIFTVVVNIKVVILKFLSESIIILATV